jgi:hypothetical protein
MIMLAVFSGILVDSPTVTKTDSEKYAVILPVKMPPVPKP